MQLQIGIIIFLTGIVGIAAVFFLLYDLISLWWRNRH